MIRRTLRNLGYVLADLVPWQAVRVARGRDWDTAVNAAAKELADDDAEYEALEPPGWVERHSPAAPRQRVQAKRHAKEWADLPTVQPGPIPVPDDHPDHK